jgi:hypothetical protein
VSELEGEDDYATEPNEVASPWTGRIGSSWTQSWPGWLRGYPLSMGWLRGHPRGLGVAFEPTLDPSRAGPMATPGPARPPPVHGVASWPPPRSGVGPNLGVAFGPTLMSGRYSPSAQVNSDFDSADRPIGGGFRCGGRGGGLGWVDGDGDGEWGWVSAGWVYEFGVIGCFHPMVL